MVGCMHSPRQTPVGRRHLLRRYSRRPHQLAHSHRLPLTPHLLQHETLGPEQLLRWRDATPYLNHSSRPRLLTVRTEEEEEEEEEVEVESGMAQSQGC